MARDPQAAAIRQRLEAEIAGAGKALLLEIDANLREACPVDTGHARANFVPSIGAAHSGEDEGSAHEAGVAAVLTYRIGQGSLFETNNVPYIDRLVLGSSAQAPAGWDLVAVDQAVATIQARYDGLRIDVTTGVDSGERGARAAAAVASAYSPFGGQ
ncbi:MAG TPA: hypothetical protein VFT22_07345 [Kofleriaceae bacterium]|nr:hypothetical protein [Kofleriaceae bacterium]